MTEKRQYYRRSTDKLLISIKSDLKCLHDSVVKYQPYLEMAIKREARRAAFQQAVIEKTAVALLWGMVAFIGTLLYEGAASHVKNLIASFK